ncbi:MAG: LamG-like jellyroll fold domain-containing protein [Myxococcota bacterium]
MRAFFALLLLCACGSSSGEPRLVVSVRTDYSPFREFDALLLRFGSGDAAQQIPRIVRETDNYVRGQQVADPRLAPGLWRVSGELIRGGRTIATRVVTLELAEGDSSVTMLFTRNCENVMCPNDNPAFDTCLGGRCVDPRCTPETPEFCPTEPLCETASDCTNDGSACVSTACEDAVCFERAEASECAAGEVCDYRDGCTPEFTDAGPADVAVDVAPVDMASPDTAPPDRGVPDEAMPDLGIDMAMDMAADMREDMGVDMRDAGPPPLLACVVASEPSDVAFFDFNADVVDDVTGGSGTTNGTRFEAAGPCGGSAIAVPRGGDHFLVSDRPSFDLDEGSIDFWAFIADPGGRARAIFSRDAIDVEQPGHITLAVMPDGTLAVRLQYTLETQAIACSAPLRTDSWHRIGLNFGPGGFELWVNGERQNASGTLIERGYEWVCRSTHTHGIAGNDNPITVGLSQVFSIEGSTDLVDRPNVPEQIGYPGLRIDNLRIGSVRRDYAEERYPD